MLHWTLISKDFLSAKFIFFFSLQEFLSTCVPIGHNKKQHISSIETIDEKVETFYFINSGWTDSNEKHFLLVSN